jgi:hypothetical protein
MRKERSTTATATIVFDGTTLVNAAANFPFPAPFIRVDTEKQLKLRQELIRLIEGGRAAGRDNSRSAP